MHRLTFIAGLAIGYVLGTRAGRERFEQLRKSALDLAHTPAVQRTAHSAKETAGNVAGKAADTVAGKVGDKLPPSITERVPYLHRKAAEHNGWNSTHR